MSQEDTMRLVAELLDKTSGPLKDIQKSLRDTANVAKKLSGEGTAGTKDHEKAYQGLFSSIEKTRRELSGAFTPAMAELGITTFGVGGALAGLVANLKSFSAQYSVMRDATRRTGASGDFLESTANAIERLTGEDPAQAIQNLANMREQMDRLSRGRPDTINAWRDAYNGLYESLGKQLVGKTLPDQIETAMEWFDHHPDVAFDKKRDILALMGMDPALATVKLGEFHEAVEKEKRYQETHPYNLKLAEGLHESFDELRDTIRGIGWEMREAFGGTGATLFKDLSADIRRDTQDLKDFFALIDKVEEKLGIKGLADRIDKWRGVDSTGKPLPPAPESKSAAQEKKSVDDFAKALKDAGATYTPMAFHEGGGTSQAGQTIATATKEGMLAAFREWFASTQTRGAGGGFQNAAFSPSNEGTGPAGAPPKFGSAEFPNLGAGGGAPAGGSPAGGGGPTGSGATFNERFGNFTQGRDGSRPSAALSGSSFLQEQRSRFAEELKNNPQTRKELAALTTLEGNAANVSESLMNRMAMTHGSIAKGLHSGFYGPINRGQLPGAMAALERDPKRMAKVSAAINEVLAGRNVLKGATDQGMASDPNGRWPGGRVYGQDQVYNDWGGGPGGHEGARRFREEQQRQVAGASRDLLGIAAKNPVASGGGGTQKVEGDAHLKVDLNGFPHGTKTDLTYGGLFTQYTLAKGKQMEASESK